MEGDRNEQNNMVVGQDRTFYKLIVNILVERQSVSFLVIYGKGSENVKPILKVYEQR